MRERRWRLFPHPASEHARWSFRGTTPRTGGMPPRIGRTMDVVEHVARMSGHIVRRPPHRTGTFPRTMKTIDSTIAPSSCRCRRNLGTTVCTVPSGRAGRDRHVGAFRSCRSCHPNRFRISAHRTYRLQCTASVSPSASGYSVAWNASWSDKMRRRANPSLILH